MSYCGLVEGGWVGGWVEDEGWMGYWTEWVGRVGGWVGRTYLGTGVVALGRGGWVGGGVGGLGGWFD